MPEGVKVLLISTIPMAGFGTKEPTKPGTNRSERGFQAFKAAVKAQKAGDLKTAEKLYMQTIDIGINTELALSNLGLVYKETGRQREAIDVYKRIIATKPSFEAYVNLANLFKDFGELKEAISCGNIAINLRPNSSEAFMNLGGYYHALRDLDKALTFTLKSIELNPNDPDAHKNLGDIYLDMSNHLKAVQEFDKAFQLKCRNRYAITMGKAACLFACGGCNESVELIKSLSAEDECNNHSPLTKEVVLKSVNDFMLRQKVNTLHSADKIHLIHKDDSSSLIKLAHRPVSEDLISELYKVHLRKLSQTPDTRNGNGLCSNHDIFLSASPLIQKLESDLKDIIEQALCKQTSSLKEDSFFNIFRAGSGTTPHNHIGYHDMRFSAWKHKYSLVYYVDVGDQNCTRPGILSLHDPDFQILPESGMVVIIPATRLHSSCYGGTKDRLMVGANFYAFDGEITLQ